MKNKKIEKYIEKLDELIIDTEIKEQIIDKIKFYLAFGQLCTDNKYLYGTYIAKNDHTFAVPQKEFLEIKIIDHDLICNYSDWRNRKIVNVIQRGIKGGHTSVYKKDIVNYSTFNNNNESRMKEQERIYNYQNELVYESKLEKECNYDTYPYEDSNIIYHNGNNENYFSLEKHWYIQNGSIIKYCLSKNFVNEHDEIREHYYICSGVSYTDHGKSYYYENLDKDLFKRFMSGEITINEVLDEIKKQKKLKKQI